jgi:hypothetical protein
MPEPSLYSSGKSAFALTALLAGGCTLAHVNVPARAGQAVIRSTVDEAGRPAVLFHSVRSRSRLREQWLADPDSKAIHSIALDAGRYVLGVECTRPGSLSFVDMTSEMGISIEAGQAYRVDCQPNGDENGFKLIAESR